MTALRSALFAILAVLWTLILGIAYLPMLLASRRRMQRLAAFWCAGLIGLARVCCGLRWRLAGAEHLPAGAAIIAAKHQSAWETLAFHLIFDDPVYVLKRELLAIPLVGWYLRKAGMIAIDRAAGASALRRMLPAAHAALARGSQIVIFPEGTRTPPGHRHRYQPGIAALYERAGDAPVIPVAVNSGLYWGRQKFLKHPGLITIEVLPPVPAGLTRARFLAELERRIETATERLCAGFPDGPAPQAQTVQTQPPQAQTVQTQPPQAQTVQTQPPQAQTPQTQPAQAQTPETQPPPAQAPQEGASGGQVSGGQASQEQASGGRVTSG